MKTIWKGAISFGLVTIPVRVYGATEEKSLRFNQLHAPDGGRIRYLDVEKEGVWPGGIESLSGVNTPEEWEHVLARAKELERRTLES